MALRARKRSATAALCQALEPRTMLAFQPPAVPLITSDPYLSVWSESNNLTDTNTVHWTGTTQELVSLIRIDGTSYRLLGDDPSTLAAFPETSVQVLPTRTIANFSNGHIAVTMTFMQPALPTNLSALSLPLSYVNWDVSSVDGATHSVQIYDSVSSQLAVNSSSQVVTWQRGTAGPLTTLDIGTTAQTYFVPVGDEVRIDWGYVYAAASASLSTSSIGYDTTEINTFTANGALTNTDDANVPRAVSNNQPVMAYAFNLGTVGSAIISRHVIVAYNEVYSIDYFGEDLTPYWARNGTTVQQMLTTAESNFTTYQSQCATFDSGLMADLTTEGGSQYATIAALGYRQTFAGMGLAADPDGQPMLFTKENTSNGDISTVDVIYPSFPQIVLFSPTLAKALLQPVMEYAASSLWTLPYAPHDLGTYPDAIGDPSGNDGNETMPLETSSTMIIMIDEIAQEEHSPEYANQYWNLLTSWANYIEPLAYQPGEQLTTNDFLGTLNNSTNLDVKGIIALGAYANLCQMRGDSADATAFTNIARADVTHWMSQSISTDGSHYLFEFGDQGTGVQLYNLVMDQILGTNLFPASVAALDISYAQSVQQTYGVPISSTTARSSLEWSMWEASMATSSTVFQSLVAPMYNYLNTTTVRVPETDIHDDTSNTQSYFDARPVIGGLYVKILTDPAMVAKYSSQDTQTLGAYAAFPANSVVDPSALENAQQWQYTTTTPTGSWTSPSFNAGGWSTGYAGFGLIGAPSLLINTYWTTPNLYLRQNFYVPDIAYSNLDFELYHDGNVTIYVNGVLAASATGYTNGYTDVPISSAALAQLVPGQTVTLSVYAQATGGHQGVDLGILNFAAGAQPAGSTGGNGGGTGKSGTASPIVLTGTGANDSFIISYNASNASYSFSGGSSLPGTVSAADCSGFSIYGGGGNDTLTVNGGTPTLLNDLGGDGSSFAVTIAAGTILFSTEHLTSLTIDAKAVAVLQSNGSNALVTSTLSIAGSTNAWTGLLDLTDNKLIVHDGSLPVLTSQTQSGYDGGAWLGEGIASSAAADDSTFLTGLGVIQNSTNGLPAGPALYTTFANQPVVSTDVLVKLTWYGDTNLDGTVDGSDYSRIDSGSLSRATGWANGDFNYDGVIDGSDYTLIDNDFNSQGATVEAQIDAQPAAQIAAKPAAQITAPSSIAAVAKLARSYVSLHFSTATPLAITGSTVEATLQRKDLLDILGLN